MAAVLVAFLLGGLIGQTPTKPSDFSGVWVQNPAKSTLMSVSPQDVELSVVDSGASVKVVRRLKASKMPSGVPGETYTGTTDGKPSEERLADLLYSRRLAREGRDLVWRITMTRRGDSATTTFSERWSLSEDGKMLTIFRTYRDGREVTQVFERKR